MAKVFSKLDKENRTMRLQYTKGNACQLSFWASGFTGRLHLIVILFLQCLVLSSAKAQTVTDTIFYDRYWRICEKPVAAFYRLGELQLGPQWHFAGDVKDFYTDGQPEMRGHYSSGGKKDGVFSFYHPNGRLKKSGAFINDTMKGLWSYYDAAGELYFQLNCENRLVFTPLFIKNPSGDTLLKNGTGRFAFKLLDYPNVFPDAREILVKGQCREGKRTGEWIYDEFYNEDWHLALKEVYEAGHFLKGSLFQSGDVENGLPQSAFIIALRMSKLIQTEAFTHDPVFGESTPGTYPPQLSNFLLRGEMPVFGSGAKKAEANVLDYLRLCAAAIGYGRWDTLNLAWHGANIRSAKFTGDCWLFGYCVQTTNPEIRRQSDLFPVERLKQYNAQINFTLYEEGVTSAVSVKGNFEKNILLYMGYYLSRLTGLAPKREAGRSVATQQNLYIFTKANTAIYRGHSYIVYRLLFSLKPPEQTTDKFTIADFANERFENDGY